jgi:predicted DCC family thiol-disulfide oxidoreductase YuxK
VKKSREDDVKAKSVSFSSTALSCQDKEQNRSPAVIYDGDCPFCSWYVERLAVTGGVDLVNAREESALIQQLSQQNIDIDRDMVLIDQEFAYKGADALHRLAHDYSQQGTSLRGTWFSYFHRMLFRWRPLAVLLYPVLRSLRNAYLKVSGQRRICRRTSEQAADVPE